MADRTRRPSYSLHNDNIVDHIYQTQEYGSQIRNFFHYSPLWRAIQDHISGGYKGQNVGVGRILIDPPLEYVEDGEPLTVRCYRGSGYAVSFKDAAIYGFRGESPHIEVRLEVEWDNGFECFTKAYTIKVPVDLAREFSEEGFNSWLENVKAEKASKQRAKDKKTLEDLMSRYGHDTIAGLKGALNES